jgi:hypothetical protein
MDHEYSAISGTSSTLLRCSLRFSVVWFDPQLSSSSRAGVPEFVDLATKLAYGDKSDAVVKKRVRAPPSCCLITP